MKKEQIINWIIFFVLNYLCFIGLQKMEMVISIKYSGVCQGNYGIFFDIFDPSKDTIFWWVVWNLSLHAMSAFIQAGVVTLTILIMGVFDRSETIMKFILWVDGLQVKATSPMFGYIIHMLHHLHNKFGTLIPKES